MSYADRRHARNVGAARKARPIKVKGVHVMSAPQHATRDDWYGAQLAEAIERRRNDEPMPVRAARPAPPVLRDAPILPRPEGMSRQVWRSLYRQAKKAARMVGPGPEVTTP